MASSALRHVRRERSARQRPEPELAKKLGAPHRRASYREPARVFFATGLRTFARWTLRDTIQLGHGPVEIRRSGPRAAGGTAARVEVSLVDQRGTLARDLASPFRGGRRAKSFRPARLMGFWYSRRREFHPPALADPGVSLSAHRALVIQSWAALPIVQWANSSGSRFGDRSRGAAHVLVGCLRNRLYFRMAQRTRYSSMRRAVWNGNRVR